MTGAGIRYHHVITITIITIITIEAKMAASIKRMDVDPISPPFCSLGSWVQSVKTLGLGLVGSDILALKLSQDFVCRAQDLRMVWQTPRKPSARPDFRN